MNSTDGWAHLAAADLSGRHIGILVNIHLDDPDRSIIAPLSSVAHENGTRSAVVNSPETAKAVGAVYVTLEGVMPSDEFGDGRAFGRAFRLSPSAAVEVFI